MLRCALVALVVGLSGTVSGCGDVIGCTEARIEAEPVSVEDPGQPVTFSARLVDDDGDPIVGRTVKFFVMTEGGEAQGVEAGRAETGADGWARLDQDGIYGPSLTGETVPAFKADFRPVGAADDDGETYCRATGEAAITCSSADGEATCPPHPSPFDE